MDLSTSVPSNVNGGFKRATAARIASLKGSLPVANIPDDVDCDAIAASCIGSLESLSTEHLTQEALWRDSFALTGTSRTFFGASTIAAAWKETSTFRKPDGFKLTPHASHVLRFGDSSWVDAHFTFETTAIAPLATCSGFLSLVPDGNGSWKIWMLRTILENFKGQPNVDKLEPKAAMANGAPSEIDSRHFDCVVVGGGQAGLGAAGRLRAVGVRTLLIDRYRQVGDSWNSRYDSLKLHTLREYAHLPFERTFGPEYPELIPKADLAKGYQGWVNKYGIDVWTSTELVACSWSEKDDMWTLKLRRESKEESITTLHVVFAIGHAQEPRMPTFPNQEKFKGTVMHSLQYKSSNQWNGKAGVIIGTGNTAHDVAEDMLDAGLSSVTMVQRGTTWVFPLEHYQKAQRGIYNADMPTGLADRISMSGPTAVTRHIVLRTTHAMAREEPERFDALERVGFKTERFGDLIYVLYERLGGHYLDVGASPKIAKGQIKIKSDAAIVGFNPSGLLFSDGLELPADVIIFTTGFYNNLREVVTRFVGPEIGEQLEDFWGVDAEGELIGAFKHSGHPKLWYMGGDLGFSRYYSRFVALQIKADLLGTPLERYTKTP